MYCDKSHIQMFSMAKHSIRFPIFRHWWSDAKIFTIEAGWRSGRSSALAGLYFFGDVWIFIYDNTYYLIVSIIYQTSCEIFFNKDYSHFWIFNSLISFYFLFFLLLLEVLVEFCYYLLFDAFINWKSIEKLFLIHLIIIR